jgi:hypothetical protein
MMGTRSKFHLPVLTSILWFFVSSCIDSPPEKMSTDLIDIQATASEIVNIENRGASIEMDHLEFNFGTIVAGKRITHSFSFMNNGDAPLILSDINATCGCTVAKDWPKIPIKPVKGEKYLLSLILVTELVTKEKQFTWYQIHDLQP